MKYNNISELALQKYDQPFKQIRIPTPLNGSLGAFVYERNLNMSKTVEMALVEYLVNEGWDFKDNPELAEYIFHEEDHS